MSQRKDVEMVKPLIWIAVGIILPFAPTKADTLDKQSRFCVLQGGLFEDEVCHFVDSDSPFIVGQTIQPDTPANDGFLTQTSGIRLGSKIVKWLCALAPCNGS